MEGTKKAENIMSSGNQTIIQMTEANFKKAFDKKKYEGWITETREQFVYFTDIEYIYCNKKEIK